MQLRQGKGALLLGLALLMSGGASFMPVAVCAQGVTAGLIPATLIVTPGSEFDMELRVTQPGAAFNGFDAIVTYDPAALTLIPTTPSSLQQGSLMTGACGNTFHRFQAGAAADSFTSVLLCANQALTGPGVLYRLRFRASTTVQSTWVRLNPSGLRFYNSGLFVTPVTSSDAVIGIGQPVTGVVTGSSPKGPGLTVSPNPSRGRVNFATEWRATGRESLTVRDVQGRAVRQLAWAGQRVAWDGLREDGTAAPEGLYFATLLTEYRSTTIHFTLLR